MRRTVLLLASLILASLPLCSQTYAPPKYLVSDELFKAVAAEYSGAAAKENVKGITQFHRIQASPGFTDARMWVVNRLKELGVTDVEVEIFPSDGKIRYQTYTGPLAWTVRDAELWITKPFRARFCHYTRVPMCLTTLSNGGDWSGEVVHVGRGTSDADYEGKDVKGKIVLASGYAAAVHRLAVIGRGALGVLIYPRAEDRPEHPKMVRYNGLWLKWEEKDKAGFGFQLSRDQAERLLGLLEKGQAVQVRAQVDAELHAGQLDVTSAFFRGSEKPEQEIILIAHLDHPQWSANDNASGSGALIEIARTLKKLIDEKKVTLKRTIRLMWVPEHSGTIAWLDKHRDIKEHAIAVLNLDMVGEDLYKTNSRLRITRTPESLSSFLNDLVENVAAQTAAANLGEPAGTKNLFHYEMTPYDPGSDHDMFNDGMVGVPALMLGHWPDWTHHTSEDTPDKVDPTTLKRVGVLSTAAALWLATAGDEQALELGLRVAARQRGEFFSRVPKGRPPLSRFLDSQESQVESRAVMTPGALEGSPQELWRRANYAERAVRSVEVLASPRAARQLGFLFAEFNNMARMFETMANQWPAQRPLQKLLVPRRLFLGPLADSYASTWFSEQLGAEHAWWEEQAEKIPHWDILVYETLNFTDGKRSLAEIEDAVRAEFGDVPDGTVERILRDLEKVGLVEFTPPKTD